MTPTRNFDGINRTFLPSTHKDKGTGPAARRRSRPSSRTRKKTGGLRLRRTGGSGILTCELGEQAPAPVAVGLDVVDEELVLLRRPGPLLDAHLVAARRPPHPLGRCLAVGCGCLQLVDVAVVVVAVLVPYKCPMRQACAGRLVIYRRRGECE